MSGSCLDLLSLFKASVLHQTLNGLSGMTDLNTEVKIQVHLSVKSLIRAVQWAKIHDVKTGLQAVAPGKFEQNLHKHLSTM